MRFVRKTSWVVLTVPLLFLSAGSASAGNGKQAKLDAPAERLFSSPILNLEDPQMRAKWSGEVNEQDKIRFLLDRIAASDYRFIRNGKTHSGRVTRQWLLYKMTHWVKGVRSARDFVARVANGSQKTGKPYLVEFPDGRVYSLQSVLANELSTFEKGLVEIKQRNALTPPVPSPHPTASSQISLSSTVVAASAVASTSTS